MARPAKNASEARLTGGQASYVLDRLIAERRVSQGEVNRYLTDMRNEIGQLEERLRSLREAAEGAVGVVTAAVRRGGRVVAQAARTRRASLTPEQRASRELQGRYLGLVRQIPASKRGHYSKVAKEKGREAAIKEMMQVLGK